MTRKYSIILLLLLASCTQEVSVFQHDNFVKFFGSGEQSRGNAVLAHADGGYLAVGFDAQLGLQRKQVLAVRTDGAGNTQWQRSYGDELDDEALAIVPIGDDYLIGGNSTLSSLNQTMIKLMRINAQGDTLSTLTRRFQQSLHFGDMAVTDDAIYVGGYCNSGSAAIPDYDYYITKLSHGGDSLLERRFPAPGNQHFNKIFIRGNGNLLLVGTTSGSIGSAYTHITVTELTPHGVPGGNGSYIHSTDSDQTYADAIYTNNTLYILYNKSGRAHLLALDATNTILWELTTGIEHPGASLAQSASGTLHLCVQAGNQLMHYGVSPSGSILSAGTSSRPIPGTVSSMVAIAGRGIVMVGSTSQAGGMMQMVKTDEELFLFRP